MRRALGLLLAASLCAAGCGTSEKPQRIVLITVDTLRWNGLAGPSADSPMPRTRARIERGLVFDQAYASSSSTQPSHASLFTGLQPWEHGVVRNGLVLAPEHEAIAEELRAAGFETRAVIASFPLAGAFGFAQGFAAFDETFQLELRDQEHWNDRQVPDNAFYSLGQDVTRRALAQLDLASAPKQFFWFHYFDPHDPYGDAVGEETLLDVGTLRMAARGPARRLDDLLRQSMAAYLQDLAALDEALEPLFARLERDAERYETHIVLTADHGESFGEDDSFGHGTRVTSAQVHVPLALVSPRVRPGVREDVCGAVDVHATLRELAGLGDGGAGRSLLAAPPPGGGEAYGLRRDYDEPPQEIRRDGSAVTLDARRFFACVGGVLYAGREGRVERLDGGRTAPAGALGESLSARFADFERLLEANRAVERDDADTLEALRALGYTR